MGRGRPQGSRNKKSIAVDRLLAEHSDSIVRKCMVMALQGDPTGMRLSMERLSAPLREDLVIKVMVALGLADVDVRALLQVHRRHLVEVMREYARVKDAAPGDVNLAMVADAEVYRLDAQVRWLDSVESRIAESGPRTRPASEAPPPVLTRRRAKVGGRG